MLPRLSVNPEVIRDRYPLLGLFLLALEALLGYALYLADSSGERIVFGVLMTVIFLFFLYVVLNIPPASAAELPMEPMGLGAIQAGTQVATETEIRTPEPQRIGGPDGSYTIQKPPAGWRVRELTMGDWIAELTQVTDPEAKAQVAGDAPTFRDILTAEAGRTVSVIPIPGKSVINGRMIPTALEIKIPFRLDIIPMERAQPPLFVHRSLAQNFLTFMGPVVTPGTIILRTFEQGELPGSGRRFLAAELRQDVEQVYVDSQQVQMIHNNIYAIAIEGELSDHLLMFRYPSVPGVEDPLLREDLGNLKALVDSFRPIKFADPEARLAEIRQREDQQFDQFIQASSEEIFYRELHMLLLRLQGWELKDHNLRQEAIRLLEPFEPLAAELQVDEPELDQLWASLAEAKAGNAADFIEQVQELLAIAIGEDEEEEAMLPDAAALPDFLVEDAADPDLGLDDEPDGEPPAP